MRVPPIDTFGRFGVSKCIKNKTNESLGIIKPIDRDTVSFGSTAKYLKKYVTLPDEIKKVLTPADAIDMFKDMEWLAQGKIDREKLGENKNSAMYDNPWLDNYYFLVLRNPENGEVLIYTDNSTYDTVWQDNDNVGIKLLKKTA